MTPRERHYENTPIQIYWEFYHEKKMKIFGWNILVVFLLKTGCEYLLEPPRRGGSNKYITYVFEQK